jgi:hypothetical protein
MVKFLRAGMTLLACLLYAGLGSPLGATTGTKIAERCGANREQPPIRSFAAPEGKLWREYKNVKAIPELDLNAGAAAFLWKGTTGNVLVNLQEPGEDWRAYTDYCFGAAGDLLFLRYELRTAWGWGYRQEGSFAGGKLSVESSEFFDTQTERAIKKPEQADDVPDALKPAIYSRKSKLPFFKLLGS